MVIKFMRFIFSLCILGGLGGLFYGLTHFQPGTGERLMARLYSSAQSALISDSNYKAMAPKVKVSKVNSTEWGAFIRVQSLDDRPFEVTDAVVNNRRECTPQFNRPLKETGNNSSDADKLAAVLDAVILVKQGSLGGLLPWMLKTGDIKGIASVCDVVKIVMTTSFGPLEYHWGD